MTPLFSTVILDPATAMIGGAALALFSAQLIWAKPEVELKRTALLGAVWGGWWGLTVAYMYFNYTDWMLVYLVDAKTLSIPLTFFVFWVLLVMHGFLAALGVGALVLHRRIGLGVAVLVGLVATNFLLMALQGHAYAHIGTYAEYHAGLAKEVAQVPAAATGMTVAGLLAAPPPIIMVVIRFLQGRKVAAAAASAAQVPTAQARVTA
ncbi:MAG: hypothetical protein JNK82_01900 [Myxococcaceae bacterium]|nr:hypothetical protein [Myxococcaceae bacterium]